MQWNKASECQPQVSDGDVCGDVVCRRWERSVDGVTGWAVYLWQPGVDGPIEPEDQWLDCAFDDKPTLIDAVKMLERQYPKRNEMGRGEPNLVARTHSEARSQRVIEASLDWSGVFPPPDVASISGPPESQEHYALIENFGVVRRCRVQAYGDLLNSYPKEKVLWIVREEDWYALGHYKKPFCVVKQRDWHDAGGLGWEGE